MGVGERPRPDAGGKRRERGDRLLKELKQKPLEPPYPHRRLHPWTSVRTPPRPWPGPRVQLQTCGVQGLAILFSSLLFWKG